MVKDVSQGLSSGQLDSREIVVPKCFLESSESELGIGIVKKEALSEEKAQVQDSLN